MAALSTLDRRTPASDTPVLKEAVRRLAGLYRPERIYLFGSVARGDADPDSDYDILIVVPDNSPQDQLQSRIGRRAIRDLGLAKDIFVCRSGTFANNFTCRPPCHPLLCVKGRSSMATDPVLVANTAIWLRKALQDIQRRAQPAELAA
jgi:predicted nucleotidyltransferase